MIKEIKTDKFSGLAVLVPDGYVGSIANMGYLVVMVTNPATFIHEKHFNSPYAIQKQLDRVNKLPPFVSLPAIKLPDGEFKILGLSDKLTDEQYEMIMPKPVAVINELREQTSTTFLNGSAKVDFEAYMKFVLFCYSVNPYAGIFLPRPPQKEKQHLGEVIGDMVYNDMRELWKEAEANTGTWLILQKL